MQTRRLRSPSRASSQAGLDFCDEPTASYGLDGYFDTYTRVVLDCVGHFPHRETSAETAKLVFEHPECPLSVTSWPYAAEQTCALARRCEYPAPTRPLLEPLKGARCG